MSGDSADCMGDSSVNGINDSNLVSIAQMCGSLRNLTTLKLDLSDWKCGSDRGFEEMSK
jgi:hypothetical protein